MQRRAMHAETFLLTKKQPYAYVRLFFVTFSSSTFPSLSALSHSDIHPHANGTRLR